MGRTFTLIAVLLVAAGISHADTIHVDWTGAGDYETIQEGIDASDTGDTVLVAPGGYFGESNRNLHFDGKGVTLMSSGGRRATTINAENLDIVFLITQGEGPDTVISGFTIMNGTATVGGGIFCNSTSPTITDCHIIACTATHSGYGGGGIGCHAASPTLIDVTISACQGQIGGGLISYLGGTPSLTRVRFESNMAYERGGGAYFENPSGGFSITDCVFDNNNCVGHYGGGLYCFNASPHVTGTTFVRNRGATGGHIILAHDSDPIFENCILAFTASGPPVFRWNEEQSPTFTRCLVYGNDDGDDLVGTVSDTLHRDPRFCGVLSGDVTLCSNSPCLPGNNVWTVLMGAEGEGCGECDTPVEEMSWGSIKALYE